MNSTVILTSAEKPCYRRCSTETVLSIQGKETDFVADSTDTESVVTSQDLEYEPVTETEDEAPLFEDSSGESEEEIIKTKIITVTMGDDGDLEFADSERTDTDTDSDIDQLGFERCAQCASTEIDTFYRYCRKCYKVRKNRFPPRPKRKQKRKKSDAEFTRTLSQDSGFISVNSQKSIDDCTERAPLSPYLFEEVINSQGSKSGPSVPAIPAVDTVDGLNANRKRRASHSFSGSESETKHVKLNDTVQPLVKSISEPVALEKLDPTKDVKDNLCIICCVEPKSGVFAHGRVAHICCCYKCAVKVWNTAKRCPICNCKVSNVLRAVVM